MVAQESTAHKDEEIIISIVKGMTESKTGAQSTRHWAESEDGQTLRSVQARPKSAAPPRRNMLGSSHLRDALFPSDAG
jgi:hypothetical protein